MLGNLPSGCMRSMLRIILWSCFMLPSFLFAETLPFTDINPWDPAYDAVSSLYANGIITDTPDHLFHPDDTIERDTFAMLSLWASCKACRIPTAEEIMRYRLDPFPDISPENPFFFCISYAKERGIVQGYVLDPTSKMTACQDGSSHSRVPFCPANTISRIEWVAMLLRQTKLWDDTKNQNVEKTMNISDVSEYWYGYAKKAVEAGIVFLGPNNTFSPERPITRWEFAIMTVRAIRLNQCGTFRHDLTWNSNTVHSLTGKTLGAYIRIGTSLSWTAYTFCAETESGVTDMEYTWNLLHPPTNTRLTAQGKCIDDTRMKEGGNWILISEITEKKTGKKWSSIQNFFSWSMTGTSDISSIIFVEPLHPKAGDTVRFTSKIQGGSWPYTAIWNFSEGSQSSKENTSHVFDTAWWYSVTFSVRDRKGNISINQMTLHVEEADDQDRDGIPNTLDRCPRVFWVKENFWCPLLPWQIRENGKLDPVEKNWGLEIRDTMRNENRCLYEKSLNVATMIGSISCQSCPCSYEIDTSTGIEPCDIIFPVILSPDKKSIYSRGTIYHVQ